MSHESSILPLRALGPQEPRRTFASHIGVNGGWATSVTRIWDECRFKTCGDLCDPGECTFADGVCVVGIGRYIPPDSCAAFAKHAGA